MRNLLTLLCAIFLISGCAFNNQSLAEKMMSTLEVEGRSYDDVWRAILKVAEAKLVITESNSSTGFVKAEMLDDYFPLSEVIGIYLKPSDKNPNGYVVEFIDLKEEDVKITSQAWTITLASDLRRELE